MFKELVKDYLRRTIITFLNGDEPPMTEEEVAKAIMDEMDKKENSDDSDNSKSLVQQLQVEEALKILEMQVPIYITKAVDEKMFEEVIMKLHDILYLRKRVKSLKESFPEDKMLATINLDKPVKIVICTPGGLLRESFAIYDAIQLLKDSGATVETLGSGRVMSAGTLLISSGTKGHRFMTKNTTLMIHDVAGGAVGTWTQIENQVAEMDKLRERYFELFKNDTKITDRQLKKMLAEKLDQYMDAEESLKYGIIDEII